VFANTSTSICHNCDHKDEYIEELEVEVEELQALKEKSEKGLLIEFPCKVGTEVYVIVDDCNGDVFDCIHDCEHCRDLFRGIETRTFSLDMFDAIGKDVFLTKEEAEQHLDWE
jgi:hypothetical protein